MISCVCIWGLVSCCCNKTLTKTTWRGKRFICFKIPGYNPALREANTGTWGSQWHPVKSRANERLYVDQPLSSLSPFSESRTQIQRLGPLMVGWVFYIINIIKTILHRCAQASLIWTIPHWESQVILDYIKLTIKMNHSYVYRYNWIGFAKTSFII